MDIKRKEKMLELVEKEITKAFEQSAKVKVTLSNSLSGYSDAGDRFHAQNAQGMVEEYLERLKKLKVQVERSSNVKASAAEPICWVEIRYSDGRNIGFYLVHDAVNFSGCLLISITSPLGRAILGKRDGDSFSYEIGGASDKKISDGVITSIE